MIALGSDHVGLELKEKICKYLIDMEIPYEDLGCYSTERVNYPEFARMVAKGVVEGRFEKGILFCGTGVGICIAANKVKGIRAVVCSEPYSAKLSRMHNETNVLCLGSRVVGEELAKMIIDEWLNAQPEGGRHSKRVDMLNEIND